MLRLIPKTREICANPLYNDRIYGFLTISLDRLSYQKIGQALGLSRQTVSKYVHGMITLGLIQKTKEYELRELDYTEASLIDRDIIEQLINTNVPYILSLYSYLINRFFANSYKSFVLRLASLKEHIGLGTGSRTNNYIITNALEKLQELNLVQYAFYHKKLKDGNVRAEYKIIKVYEP